MSFIAKLPDWGLIHASGPDAQTFLHGQLTNDLLHLAPDAAQWSGYCTAKGRMLAGFLLWRDAAEGFYLACDRTLLPALVKRLRMFVLRAKVVIEDGSERYAALGAHGDIAAAALSGMRVRHLAAQTDGMAPIASATSAEAAAQVTEATEVTAPSAWCIALPTVDGVARALIWSQPAALAATSAATGLQEGADSDWIRLMVQAGEAWITPATQEAFVPQMINFDALDGINFKKGCYPGQEIVARAHYRGAVKRRMYRALVDAPAKAGDVVYASDLNGQESGIIALAAPAAGLPHSSEVLAVIQIQSRANADIRLGGPDGPLLHFAPLPYVVPEAA